MRTGFRIPAVPWVPASHQRIKFFSLCFNPNVSLTVSDIGDFHDKASYLVARILGGDAEIDVWKKGFVRFLHCVTFADGQTSRVQVATEFTSVVFRILHYGNFLCFRVVQNIENHRNESGGGG